MKEGIWTALVTPFTQNDELDVDGLLLNISNQKKSGVAGIVALGTTGESPTLTDAEKKKIIQLCVASGMHVMVGTGTNCTRTTIAKTKEAADLGAQSALVISPYYNRPTQEGLFIHLTTLADQSPIPIILYDHPGRTGVTLTLELRRRLAQHPNIAAIKDATGSLANMQETLPFMKVYTGDDSLGWDLKKLGGKGIISVISNLLPELMVALWNGSESAHQTLKPYFAASALESNPIPLKTMMNLYGMPAGHCRLPLCNPQPETLKRLKELCSQEILTSLR
jgi:4-hydroxy-tetrahydrodipicolinate synthase